MKKLKNIEERYYKELQDFAYYRDFDHYYEKLRARLRVKSETQRERFRSIKHLIHSGSRLAYLGLITAIQKNDWEIFNDCLFTAAHFELLRNLSSSDHCGLIDKFPFLFCANRFDLFAKACPEKLGLSKNGERDGVIITNLIMAMYYQNEEWLQQTLDQVATLEKPAAIIRCLEALSKQDFDEFSVQLGLICKAERRSRNSLYSNNFLRAVSFWALGLINFAYYLYGEKSFQIRFPKESNFLTEFAEYQRKNHYKIGKNPLVFDEMLQEIEWLMQIEIPETTLCFNPTYKVYEIDHLIHSERIADRLMALSGDFEFDYKKHELSIYQKIKAFCEYIRNLFK